jgi:hypothetical protein
MDLPFEIWSTIFEYVSLSDAFQLSIVSARFSAMIAQYKGPLFIDRTKALMNKNRSPFIHRWLRHQSKLDVTNAEIVPLDICRIIDQYCGINIITIRHRSHMEEREFINMLKMYVKMDPSYEQRDLVIELGYDDSYVNVKFFSKTRIKFYRRICIMHQGPFKISEIKIGSQCHECFKERSEKSVVCFYCRQLCCPECTVSYSYCKGCHAGIP